MRSTRSERWKKAREIVTIADTMYDMVLVDFHARTMQDYDCQATMKTQLLTLIGQSAPSNPACRQRRFAALYRGSIWLREVP
jgi:hypothetical protein